jgi:hypothetical protein
LLDAKTLREVLNYDPETGVFAWNIQRRGMKAGKTPGCINTSGYRVIRFDGVLYFAHRLAWLYVYGEWPSSGHVDHINHLRADNRIANLRDVAVADNIRNRKGANKNSSTGSLGVGRHGDKWRARVMVNRKNVHLGTFDSLEAASRAANKAREFA